jgi:hypothetical protein
LWKENHGTAKLGKASSESRVEIFHTVRLNEMSSISVNRKGENVFQEIKKGYIRLTCFQKLIPCIGKGGKT